MKRKISLRRQERPHLYIVTQNVHLPHRLQPRRDDEIILVADNCGELLRGWWQT
jgi:hypothetical protein